MPAFMDDVIAFTEALGAHNAAIILPLAAQPWESEVDRDDFITGLVGLGESL